MFPNTGHMRVADHVLFVALAVLGPIWTSTMGYRRLQRAAPEAIGHVRRSVYRGAIALQWGLTLAVLALWAVAGRAWSSLGLVPRPTWGLLGVAIGTAVVIVIVARQRRAVLGDDDSLAEVRERMGHLEPLLPRTASEMRWFAALAITAGICEEVLYRGFMIQYLAHFFGIFIAAAVGSTLFGLGHAYQGSRGVALTGMLGAFLAAVYLVSGSLFAPMLLHALMDLHSGHLAHMALVREGQLEAERAREEAEWREAMAAAANEVALTNRGTAHEAAANDATPSHAPLEEPGA